jgi:hypothetical protein
MSVMKIFYLTAMVRVLIIKECIAAMNEREAEASSLGD